MAGATKISREQIHDPMGRLICEVVSEVAVNDAGNVRVKQSVEWSDAALQTLSVASDLVEYVHLDRAACEAVADIAAEAFGE